MEFNLKTVIIVFNNKATINYEKTVIACVKLMLK